MPKKKLTGTVVSNKTKTAVVVEVERFFHHPRYQKRLKSRKRYLVHDPIGADVGAVVEIRECRPMSRKKRFEVARVFEEAE